MNNKTMKVMDGNEAAAYVSYAFTEVAAIYPITPSSNMAEFCDEWAAKGKTNIFGQPLQVVEMQSEAGAAGTMHGSLQAGALTTSYTASQGLLLMIPSMFKMAGELLPGVLHVSARAVASQALSIFGDHSDVMACRQTGFAMLASSSVQQVMHLAPVAHLAAIKGRVPFLHFFDGFRTSHEAQKIEIIDYEEFDKLVDHEAIASFRANALNPEHPVLRGTAQNPDIFFQAREASNPFYEAIPGVVEDYMNAINKLTGRNYGLFNYHGAPDAERVIIAMGSACEAIEETVDYLNAKGEKVGLVTVHLYRPFSAMHFLRVLPKSARKIAVLDRTKEPGSLGEPLYQDVCTVFMEKGGEMPLIIGGRYGLGSKDVFPSQIAAVYAHLNHAQPKNHFTVGINDDVTNTSLAVGEYLDLVPKSTYSAKFWGIGSDGTVGANKNSITIIGDNTDMYAQAYFSYDSKKSGGITQSHLRFGKEPIRSTYLVKAANFVACHNASYVDKYDMLSDLKPGGTFLLNCSWSDAELDEKLPASMKRELANKNVKLYVIDATTIASKIGLGRRINSVLQAAFFKLTNIIPIDEAVKHMKDAIQSTYGRLGEKVIDMNFASVDAGIKEVREVKVPATWAEAISSAIANGANPVIARSEATKQSSTSDYPAPPLDCFATLATTGSHIPAYIRDFTMPINALKGDIIPVSAFKGREDGTFEQGTSAYEKRGVAVDVPKWIPENCIQCNRCSYVCPHATIRPFLLTEAEARAAPEGMETKTCAVKGAGDYQYRIQVSPLDCYGCGVCAVECPTKEKALEMEPFETGIATQAGNWNYCIALDHKPNPDDKFAVRGSQFEVPLLEFSGACAGCGETPYTKLITQLYGDRLYIGNATGCSSIWGGSAPSTPYTKNANGQGPAWANSLFEDTAEFTLGFQLAIKQRRGKLAETMSKLLEIPLPAEWGYKEAIKEWLDNYNDGEGSKLASQKIRAANAKALEKCGTCNCEAKTPPKPCNCGHEAESLLRHIAQEDDMLVKKSVWAFGGDGWAYDIGYGGLDHVIASGEDVNLLVMDTEVYSNTGGQSSKASPAASVAKFTTSGKKVSKKDLGQMAMAYGTVYVAQIAMGADYNQTIKAIREAEAFPGPSVVIAYATCINHGIKGGMANAQAQMKNAVAAGYWHLYRYNPLLADEGKNPFIMDSKDPTVSFQDYIRSETRYTSLQRQFPELADKLFDICEKDAKRRLAAYKRLASF